MLYDSEYADCMHDYGLGLNFSKIGFRSNKGSTIFDEVLREFCTLLYVASRDFITDRIFNPYLWIFGTVTERAIQKKSKALKHITYKLL